MLFCPCLFRASLTALFVLNLLVASIPLSAVANRFELRCQSKATDAIILKNLSLPVGIRNCKMFRVDYLSSSSDFPKVAMLHSFRTAFRTEHSMFRWSLVKCLDYVDQSFSCINVIKIIFALFFSDD